MATDSTELTFVRCPSCRSLVPAVSTRCRMCGAGLEEDERASNGEAGDFSTPESVLESAESESDADFDDPLGAYLEDFEDDEEPVVGGKEQDSEDEGFADDRNASAPLTGFSDDQDDDIIEDIQFDADEEFVAASDSESVSGSIETSVAPVMTGAMKGDSEPSKKISSRNASQDVPAETSRKPETFSSPTNQEPQFERDESRSWRAQQRQVRRREPMPSTALSREAPLPERSAPVPERIAPVRERAIQQSVENEGLLHGWLVNFSDPKGVGYELREGKFFVSHAPLKANDFVLNHPSVSTPHALMTLSDEYGLLVQDLMSETGVFVRREGDAIYRKEEEAVILGHGDWIRFGEEEFLVTLIPSLPRG